MEINWIILVIVGAFALALILYLIFRNQKDKHDMIDTLNAQTEMDEKDPKNEDEL